MKKHLVLLAAIALLAAACNSKSNVGQVPPPPPAAPTTQTFSNATYGFSFTYPIALQTTTPAYSLLEDKIVQLQIPQSAYPNTNFGDAAFSVSAQYAAGLGDCLKLNAPENSDGFKTKVTINDVDFYMTNSNGAGAGNLYQSKVYRTVKSTGGACIELMETIHTSNIGNYPPNTVTEVNTAPIQEQLDSILNSFKFQQ